MDHALGAKNEDKQFGGEVFNIAAFFIGGSTGEYGNLTKVLASEGQIGELLANGVRL